MRPPSFLPLRTSRVKRSNGGGVTNAVLRGLVGIVTLVIPTLSFAQVVVETDRPDAANSTKTVPPSYVQVETGYRYSRDHVGGGATVKRSSAETSVRVGITPSLEIRLDGDAYVDLRDGERESGIGDLSVGAKWRLLDTKTEPVGVSFGLTPFVKLPTARTPIGSEQADFGLIGLLSVDLPKDLAVDLNAGIAALGRRHDGPFPQGLAAVTIGYKVMQNLNTFAEAFFASSPESGGRDFVGAGIGAIWVVHRRIAIDAGLDTTAAGRGPEFGLRVGVTLLFGR